MIPHKCPVCEGRGQVHASFYGESTNTVINMVACKSCYGTGIVWEYSLPYTPFPYNPPTYPINPPPEYPYTICNCTSKEKSYSGPMGGPLSMSYLD